ncbi:MAG: YIP1 family protein [Rubrobacteridae bacterium]|nr:YIP1 family protein [Rubrobacteridae bacterium]
MDDIKFGDNEKSNDQENTVQELAEHDIAETKPATHDETQGDQTLDDMSSSTATDETETVLEKQTLFDLLYGVLVKPSSTFKYISAKKPWVTGALLYLLSTWIGMVAGLPAQRDSFRAFDSGNLTESSIVIIVIIALILVLPFFLEFGLFIMGGIYHLLAKLLKGEGSYKGIIASLGFASSPQVLLTPLSLLFFVEGPIGKIIAMGITFSLSFAFSIWVLILNILAVRENYKLSTARAIAVCLIPIVAAIIISIVVFILLIAFVVTIADQN